MGPIRRRWLVLSALAAAAASAILLRPWDATTADPDAAASVLFFQRIVAGSRLEAFVPTTPKPLLTLVFGLTWSAGHAWWLLVLATQLAFGALVALAAAVSSDAVRPSPVASVAAFAAAVIAFGGSADLLAEVSRGNSIVWGLLAWVAAYVLLVGSRPALAGVALLVGGTARLETLLLDAALVVGAVAIAMIRLRWGPTGFGAPGGVDRRRPSARAALTAGTIGMLAVPIAGAHDLLLTGDPLFWSTVASRYTELYAPGLAPQPPGAFIPSALSTVIERPLLVALGLAGLASLVVRRRWVLAGGLTALVIGVLAALTFLAARGTYVSARYYEPIALSFTLAACVAVGEAAGRLAAGLAGWTGRWRNQVRRPALAVALLAAAVAIGVASPPLPFDRAVSNRLDGVRSMSARFETVRGPLVAALARDGSAGSTGAAGLVAGDAAASPLDAPFSSAVVAVPVLLRNRIVVETGATLLAVVDTLAPSLAGRLPADLRAGQLLYHDVAADRPSRAYAWLAGHDQSGLEAIVTDEAAGVFLYRVVAGTVRP